LRQEALEATRAKAGLAPVVKAPKAKAEARAEAKASPSGTMLTKSASAAKQEGVVRKSEVLAAARAKALAAAGK